MKLLEHFNFFLSFLYLLNISKNFKNDNFWTDNSLTSDPALIHIEVFILILLKY